MNQPMQQTTPFPPDALVGQMRNPAFPSNGFAAPTGGGTPPPMGVTPPGSHMQAVMGKTVGGAVHEGAPRPEPTAAPIPPQVVGLKHRVTGQVYDFSVAMAKSAEVYPVDASGNEVFNVQGLPGAQRREDMPPDPAIAGFARYDDLARLRSEFDTLKIEMAQLRMEMQRPT